MLNGKASAGPFALRLSCQGAQAGNAASQPQAGAQKGFVAPRRAGYGPVMSLPPFHLAFPVDDLEAARAFYGGVMGCAEGRSSAEWVDFDFHGHQIVAHLAPGKAGDRASNHVDGHGVPVPHFGLVLSMEAWEALAARLKAAGVAFVIEPTIRFKGEVGEQATMFLRDPSGNALEFKAFADPEQLFAR
jgi:extradiol dioxygenase family protein